jgi:hypothetical protein
MALPRYATRYRLAALGRFCKPKVGGSIPSSGTSFAKHLAKSLYRH